MPDLKFQKMFLFKVFHPNRKEYHTMKKFFAVLTACTFCFAGSSFSAAADDTLSVNGLSYILEESTVTITGYTGDAARIEIPQKIDGYDVTRIGKCAFEDNLTITSVVLPDTIEVIDYKAFADCRNLETINFPDSLGIIGDYAFTTCHSLQSIDLNQVESIGECTFQLCISLEEITVPGSIRFIPDHAFHGCSGVTSLTFEPGVEEIDAGAAVNMYSLAEINVPDSVTSIGEHALGYTYYHPNYTRLDAVIHCSAGSAAESYAKTNGFDLVLAGVELGDLNADGKADANDAAMILVAAAAKGAGSPSGLSAAQETAADADGSGDYNAADAALILQYAANAGISGVGSFREFIDSLS